MHARTAAGLLLLLSGAAAARPVSSSMSQAAAPAVPADTVAGASRTVHDGTDRYEATIRRTAYGVAHIEAAHLASLGFGEGYAQAEDHLCTIADRVVRVRGERAKYFGRGPDDVHLVSDIAMRALRVHERAADRLAAQPAELVGWFAGFSTGYNHYLERTGRNAVPGWCRGEEWVRPISPQDVEAYQQMAVLLLANMDAAIASAQPPTVSSGGMDASASHTRGPGAGAGSSPTGVAPPLENDTEPSDLFGQVPGASNGWALGRERTESGRGMLLANPHYPWHGANRFWEKHLRIPGELNVYGMNIIGGPGVLIGFNDAAAWTHTVSAGTRVTFYSLDLVPGVPTRYRYGDEERDMTPIELVIEVRGEPEPVRRTLWSTHYGPVITTGPLSWTADRAYTIRDANVDNPGVLAHLLGTARASSLDELRHAHAEHQALPMVNTMAVSADGVAWFANSPSTPDLTDEALSAWRRRLESDSLTRQLWQGRNVLLDGSDPLFEWRNDPEAGKPGVVPFRRMPQLERTDYIFNANDSYWLAHADTLLRGDYSPLHGPQRSPISPRTRSNVLHLTNATPDKPAGDDGRFSLAELQTAALANRSLTADLLVPELVGRCRATPRVTVEEREVDLTHACAVLDRWDRRFDVVSRGAVLFREWISRYAPLDLVARGRLFAVDFDPGDPVNTPHTLAPGDLALQNLARAVMVLESRDVALDAPLGELQFAPSKLPRRIPLHGGHGHWEGLLNLMQGGFVPTTLEPVESPRGVEGSRLLTEAGYPVFHGTSFIMAVEFTAGGPRANAILTYGQSGDPESEHFTDQTELFSRKEWRPILFRPEDVAAGTLREYTITADRLAVHGAQQPSR